MKTYLDCVPCFLRQAIDVLQKTKTDEKKSKIIIDEICGLIQSSDLSMTPPEMAGKIQNIVKKTLGKEDLYKEIKDKSNRLAMIYYEKFKGKVSESKEPLLISTELAIAGNIIDFGVKNTLDVEEELNKILKKEDKIAKNSSSNYFCFDEFKKKIFESDKIIYLADNVGETFFDKILIDEIKKEKPAIKLYYSVRGYPILNDALIEDAIICGIDKSADVISTGSDIPGTVLQLCEKEFLNIYKTADMVISKGQGNFESFVDNEKPVFYLFMAKCPVVATEIGGNVGDINLFYNRKGFI